MTETARFFTLKPSVAKVQAKREAAAARAKSYRSRKRAKKALAQAEAEAAGGGGLRPDVVGFASWFGKLQHGGLLDYMSEAEAESFQHLAWAAYHRTLPAEVWLKTIKTAAEKRREAGIAATIAWWSMRKPRRYSNEGSDGC